MTAEELLLASLAELETPALDPAFAARVQKIARAELSRATAGEALPLRLLLSGAVVPVLLLTSAAVDGAVSVETAAKIFSEGSERGTD